MAADAAPATAVKRPMDWTPDAFRASGRSAFSVHRLSDYAAAPSTESPFKRSRTENGPRPMPSPFMFQTQPWHGTTNPVASAALTEPRSLLLRADARSESSFSGSEQSVFSVGTTTSLSVANKREREQRLGLLRKMDNIAKNCAVHFNDDVKVDPASALAAMRSLTVSTGPQAPAAGSSAALLSALQTTMSTKGLLSSKPPDQPTLATPSLPSQAPARAPLDVSRRLEVTRRLPLKPRARDDSGYRALQEFIDQKHKGIFDLLTFGIPSDLLSKYDELIKKDRETEQTVEDRRKAKAEERDLASFPPLNDEQLREIDAVIKRKGDAVIVEEFNIPIAPKDIGTLCDRQWLNDEIINFYGKLIMDRAEKDASKPRVFVFNTFFYLKMSENGYEPVRRWTKKTDVFTMDYVIFPVHLGMHWCLANINFKEKRFEYYDSLRGSNPEAFRVMREYVQAEHKSKKNKPFDLSGWVDYVANDAPTQENGYDCGVFTCQSAEFLSRGQRLTYTQKDMHYFRRRMIWEIVHKQLLVK